MGSPFAMTYGGPGDTIGPAMVFGDLTGRHAVSIPTNSQLMTIFDDLLERLRDNVESGLPDMCDAPMKVPASSYADPSQYAAEIEQVFLRVPLLVALACDVREPGDFLAYDVAGRPIVVVRGDDGTVRTLLNVCRHRGARLTDEHCGSARRFTCPYHSWSYDNPGHARRRARTRDSSVRSTSPAWSSFPPRNARCGVRRARPDNDSSWTPGSAASTSRSRAPTRRAVSLPGADDIESPNWKLPPTATSTATTSATCTEHDRTQGDHQPQHLRLLRATRAHRIRHEADTSTFDPGRGAHRRLHEPGALRLPERVDLRRPRRHVDVEPLLPGPTVDRSTTLQFQYYREPVEGDLVAIAEAKRTDLRVGGARRGLRHDLRIGDALGAMGDGHVVFGRNESGNQHLHDTIRSFTRRG
jgi:carnitine monooxygenase subunit